MAHMLSEHSYELPEYILKVLEAQWELILPKAYREFLLKYNGGRPSPSYFNFFNDPQDGSIIRKFFGVYPDPNYDLVSVFKTYKVRDVRVSKRLFPIAGDSFGNLICISVMNPDRGKIYFWDHDRETDPPDDSNLTLIANTFEEFLDGLHEPPEA